MPFSSLLPVRHAVSSVSKTTRGLLAVLSFWACATAAQAGGLSLSGTWVRWLPGDLPLGGYFELHNDTGHSVQLTAAKAPDFARAMLHNSVEENGTERMVHVDSVTVKPGATLKFAPGGYHIMLMHRVHPVHPGDRLPITLVFDGGEQISADFAVRGADGN